MEKKRQKKYCMISNDFKEKIYDFNKIKAGKDKDDNQRYIIRLSSYKTDNFFNYIGPCPKEIEDIYGYKWP